MNIIKNSNFTKLNIKDGNIHKLRGETWIPQTENVNYTTDFQLS